MCPWSPGRRPLSLEPSARHPELHHHRGRGRKEDGFFNEKGKSDKKRSAHFPRAVQGPVGVCESAWAPLGKALKN